MIDKVRELVALGYGRRRIAIELKISERKARALIKEVTKQPTKQIFAQIEDEVNEVEGTRTVIGKSEKIRTLEDLIEFHQIDMNIWEVEKVLTNMWEMGYKVDNTSTSRQLHQIKASFKRKEKESQLFLERKALIERAYTPNFIISNQPLRGEYQTWLVLGCVHVPYHNTFLWDGVMNYIHTHNISGIILAGDFLDMKSISSYEADKVFDITLSDEYLAGITAKKDIESVISGDTKKVFISGNHEFRFVKYMSSMQNARLGSALPTPHKALGMDDWEILTNWQEDYFLLGNNLEVIHGTIIAEHAASAHLKKSSVNNRSVLFFHTHRFQTATTGQYSAWNCGTLCDIDNTKAFGYVNRHIRQSWQNGFAIVTVDEDGETYVQPVKCGRKSFFLDGKKY